MILFLFFTFVQHKQERYENNHLYIKWPIRLDRDTQNIKIGCVEKTIDQWTSFFQNKEKIELSSDDRNYKKIESAFKIAVQMREHLILMNDKKK